MVQFGHDTLAVWLEPAAGTGFGSGFVLLSPAWKMAWICYSQRKTWRRRKGEATAIVKLPVTAHNRPPCWPEGTYPGDILHPAVLSGEDLSGWLRFSLKQQSENLMICAASQLLRCRVQILRLVA